MKTPNIISVFENSSPKVLELLYSQITAEKKVFSYKYGYIEHQISEGTNLLICNTIYKDTQDIENKVINVSYPITETKEIRKIAADKCDLKGKVLQERYRLELEFPKMKKNVSLMAMWGSFTDSEKFSVLRVYFGGKLVIQEDFTFSTYEVETVRKECLKYFQRVLDEKEITLVL